jgi:hypothetical protein
MRQRRAQAVRLVRAVAAVVLCAWLLVPAAPAVAAPEDLCSAQVAAAKALQARIAAHNAKPHVFQLPRQAAALAAYNAEATQLEAERATANANLQACLEAMVALAAAGVSSTDLRAVPPDTRTALDQAKKQIPAGWQPPTPPAAGQRWQVPKGTLARPLYDILRKGNPGDLGDVRLRGQSRPKVGDPDPAYPRSSGTTIGGNADGDPKVSPDHIVPLAQIINMPGFVKLSPQNMYAVTRAPLNLQWLSFKANLSKSSRSVASMSGVDPQWQADQVRLEQQVAQQLQEIINKLLKSQG